MEKKFDLEKFVKDNYEHFNTEEPGKGHFDRFNSSLNQDSAKKNRFLYRSMRYAAVIVLLITGVLIFNNTDLFKGAENATADNNTEITEDFNEITSYYDSQLDQKLAELKTIECKQGGDQKDIVSGDLNELTDSYSELKNEYQNDPENSMIKNAIINNYQMRLNILDMVMNKLKNYC